MSVATDVAATLRELRGLSYPEIAQQLCLPEGTVKSRCSRARSKLAESLDYFAAGAAAE